MSAILGGPEGGASPNSFSSYHATYVTHTLGSPYIIERFSKNIVFVIVHFFKRWVDGGWLSGEILVCCFHIPKPSFDIADRSLKREPSFFVRVVRA